MKIITIILGIVAVSIVLIVIRDDPAMLPENTVSITPSVSVLPSVMVERHDVVIDFTRAQYEAAIATDKVVVLYFYANWCPICRAEFPIMQSAIQELNSDRVVAFRVNYKDNETDADEVAIAQEFGVPYQHTKVFVKNGQRILKSPEGWDKARYIMEINKAISAI